MEKEMKFEAGKPVFRRGEVYIEREEGPELITPDMDMQTIEAICREKDAAAAAARELNERTKTEMYIVAGIRQGLHDTAFDIVSKPDLSAGEIWELITELYLKHYDLVKHEERLEELKKLLSGQAVDA